MLSIAKNQMPTLAVKLALCLLHALVALDMELGGRRTQSGHDADARNLNYVVQPSQLNY
jgi:hypothetical protein